MTVQEIGHLVASEASGKYGFSVSHGMLDEGYQVYIGEINIELLITAEDEGSIGYAMEDEKLLFSFKDPHGILKLAFDYVGLVEHEGRLYQPEGYTPPER